MMEPLVIGLFVVLLLALAAAPLLRRRPSRPPGRAAPAKPPPRPAGEPTEHPPAASGVADGGVRIRGRVRGSSRRAVGGIVEQHPDEAVSVLRRWMRSGERSDDGQS